MPRVPSWSAPNCDAGLPEYSDSGYRVLEKGTGDPIRLDEQFLLEVRDWLQAKL